MNEVNTIRHTLRNLTWYRAELERMGNAIRKLPGNDASRELTTRSGTLRGQLDELVIYLTKRREELDSANDQEAESGVVPQGTGPQASPADDRGEASGVPELPAELPVRVRPEQGAGGDPVENAGRASRAKKEGK